MGETDNATRQRPSEDPLVGKVLDGRFRIVERLGAGGMGTVYKAVQAPLERLVALKVLNANYDSERDPGFQRRFFLEASVTSKLRHPNTITVIDYGKTEDSIYYLAMEYVEGITLAQLLLQAGALEWPRALQITQQVCRSLREAHRAGVIHRDLKPANIMVRMDDGDHDLVKVLDFGLVKSFLPDGQAPAADLTQAGVFLGSPQYMAPEQAKNQADPRSDVYSLGVVVFQMLMGKPPFVAEQSIDVIVKHMKERAPSFRSVRPDLDVPGEVEGLVMRCLEKEPALRFQSMDEMLDALRRVSAGAGMSGVFSPSSQMFPLTPPPLPTSSPAQSGMNPAFLLTPSGPQRQPGSQPGRRPGDPPSGPASPDAHTLAIDISVEEAQRPEPPEPRHLAALPSGGGTTAMFSAVSEDTGGAPRWAVYALGAVLLLGGGALLLTRTAPEEPAGPRALQATAAPPQGPGSAPPPPAAPHQVRFRITTVPEGAEVRSDGKRLGTTPLDFELPAGTDGSASADLTFRLAGYEPITLSAAGSGEVLVTHRLVRRPPPRPVAPRPTPREPVEPPSSEGYKDDPYQ